MLEGFGPRPEGDVQLLLGPPVHHRGAGSVSGGCQFRHEAGLADARLAGDHHQARLARDRGLPPFGQQATLGGPAGEREPLADLEGGGEGSGGLGLAAPGHEGHRHRIGQAFQRPLSGGHELMVAPAAGQEADEVGHEDLAAAGLGAQPRRFHDRRAEAVVVLEGHVAGADPDAHREPVVGVTLDVGADGLLDGDGRTDGLRRTREHGQHAVAEALDHLAVVGGDGVGQQAVVDPTQRLGPLLPERDPVLGRSDEVGHQDRRRLRGHAVLPVDQRRTRVAASGGKDDSQGSGRPGRDLAGREGSHGGVRAGHRAVHRPRRAH